ncbi:PREDICTED: U3 small nucleolar ribonucleoprotein protein MPP10 [Tarenaya hassleriana]|uniref:U3 small nucleolar ribonucleoprotein protein MPP10 n=1 Tax=Tarenaya hassleriana TaxID=28532 RepID=UPI00053C4A53|nr:PREDICTED: U3 small nucleolar ribonucleoprotein protein MPP10 [Tarenaya hassleriana]
MAEASDPGLDALHKLKSTDPPVFLAPSCICEVARDASQYLFSKLKEYTPKSPFDQLLVDGFDAEQVWQQIDMQSQPLLSSLRKEVKKFEKNPQEISNLGSLAEAKSLKLPCADDAKDMEMDGFGTDDDDEDDELEEENNGGTEERLKGGSESEGGEEEDEDDREEDEEDGEEKEDEEKEKDGENRGIEDGFFSIKQLQEFLEEGETEELGLDNKNRKGMAKGKKHNVDDVDDDDDEDEEDNEDDKDEEDEDDDEDEEEDKEFGAFGDEDEGEEAAKLENAKYEDFFGGKKKGTKRKSEDSSEEQDTDGIGNQGKEELSTHEKELLKLQSKIKQMEKSNLDPKHWTMQGEVTAAKRPKNSALEVDLDFEHNVRPAPIITEEVTASLEELIKNRIIEGRFDDVQNPLSLPTKAPREVKELDDNKSKKGLAEVYEEEYVQKANPAFAPTSHSDELKKEAGMLFKKLCLKLDALSHFHFTPKPVIEDMSIQVNVPAIAMEEVAPVAVSDAALLAPEEIFSGKGDIKEESELTKEERKRRRAKKKRKFKANSAKRTVKNPQDIATQISKTGSED